MSEQEKKFIETFKRQIIISFAGLIFIVAGTSIGFYYNTINAMTQTSKDIETLKACSKESESEIDELQRSKIDRTEYREDLSEIKDLIKEIRNDLKKIK